MPGKSNEITDSFNFAVEQVRSPDTKNSRLPTDAERLQFYALYKQATVGKCTTAQPWAIQVVERAKWNAWNSLGTMSKETAMLKYCDLYMEVTSN